MSEDGDDCMKTKDRPRGVVVKAGSSTGNVLAAAGFATLFWYCFDDFLAGLTYAPGVGEVAWYHALSVGLFATTLLSVAGTDWSSA